MLARNPGRLPMSMPSNPSAAGETRAQRVEALLSQVRPVLEATARQMIERAIDVPEAEEFGAIDLEFRDAGLRLANEVRQAALAGRKKRGTSGAA